MIYLDNAATTPLHPEVFAVMTDIMSSYYGNPSSVHAPGRQSRVLIEDARKTVADLLDVSTSEIFFTSSGTEAINTAIYGAFHDLKIKHFITSPTEHHAVLHSIKHLCESGQADLHLLPVDKKGHIIMSDLEYLLKRYPRAFVALMHSNNETGNLLPFTDTAAMCEKYGAIFLCDTVQSFGKYIINARGYHVQFLSCSAHKFHGPKGVGFLYIRGGTKIHPMIHGGGQERNMRSGTENIYGIAGLAKAMEVAYRDLKETHENISTLKIGMIKLLKENFQGISFNGDCETGGLYNLISVNFPHENKADVLIQKLDIEGVACSGGSACTSGATSESPVLKAMGVGQDVATVRFSFSRFNTIAEVESCIGILKKILL